NRITPNQPAVVLNGAGLYDFNLEKMIWRNTIGKKGRDFVNYISTEFDDIFKSVDIGIYFDDYVYIVHSGLLSKTTMHFDKAHFEYVKSVDRVPEEGWMKVIFWALPATMMKLQSRILTMENPDANFMPSSAVTLEMLQKDTHKGVGIMKLADMLGIEKSHVAAIGDYYNDWDMLGTVGLPACAGQAPSSIKRICKFNACHCNKGCVADLLNYIMSGKADEDIKNGRI
ncbi:MAG: HAD hydrolase family protein, partial [Eubacterium sp.]|nr:HAD hydrolase family protein [Eubacterium sp.]